MARTFGIKVGLGAAQGQRATPEQRAGPRLWEGATGMRKSWDITGTGHPLGKQRSSGTSQTPAGRSEIGLVTGARSGYFSEWLHLQVYFAL